MGWIQLCVNGVLHTIAFLFDLLTFIPYYFIQEPKRVLELSSREKAVSLNNHPAGPLRCAEETELVTTPDEECCTLSELFQKAVAEYLDQPCLGSREFIRTEEVRKDGKTMEKQELGEYIWTSYQEVSDIVALFGRGLLALGVVAKQNIIIFAETRQEWIIAAEACFQENITLVTLYTTLSDENIVHVAAQAEATHIITSERLLARLHPLIPQLMHITTIICMKGRESAGRIEQVLEIEGRMVKVASFEEITQKGRSVELKEFDDDVAQPHDIAVIIYTSGSTGLPKGVMLSHANILAACAGVIARTNVRVGGTHIAYLPLAHVLELVAEISCLYTGVRIGYGTPNTLITGSSGLIEGSLGDLATLMPTVLVSVPSLLDRIHKKILQAIRNRNPVYSAIFNFALRYKRKWLYRGANTPIVNALVMKNIRQVVGGQLQCILSGGAPLNPDTQEFLRLTLCCPVLQGYGLTETCCAGTISECDDLSSGHVGAPLACSFIKLIDWEEGEYMISDTPHPRGEVWIGGPNVASGYYKDSERTEEFQQNGFIRWHATSDIGRLRADGSLVIVDRKKDIIKLSTGYYVSLGKVEVVLKSSPLVDNLCAIARSDDNQLVCIVIPNSTNILSLAASLSLPTDNWSAVCDSQKLTDEVLLQLQAHGRANGLAAFEVPRKIRLVSEQWLPSNGLVTSSMKLKRKQLSIQYKDIISEMYSQL